MLIQYNEKQKIPQCRNCSLKNCRYRGESDIPTTQKQDQ